MMQCSDEEIAEKRRIAQEKLAQKNSPWKSCASAECPGKQVFKFKSLKTTKPYDKPEATNNERGHFDKPLTAKFILLSKERFSVEVNYNAQIIDMFKTIKSRNYGELIIDDLLSIHSLKSTDVQTKKWSFDVSDHAILVSKIESMATVERLPNYVLRAVTQVPKNTSDLDLSCLDPELTDTLMPFQEEGVRYGIMQNGRCLIADDMGLGKTLQALGIASYYKNDWPMIIATTTSVKHVWQQTIQKYMPSVPLMRVQYIETGKDYFDDSLILIMSHEMMARCLNKLIERKYGFFILDESHVVKNSRTKCSQAAVKLANLAKRVILLSGTPALSRPSELYTQLAMIDSKFFGNFFDYSRRYCDGHQGKFGWDATGKSNLQELEIILNLKFMIRRTKEEVLNTLPNKEQEIVTLNVNLNGMSEEDRACLNALALKYSQKNKGAQKQAALLSFFSETARIKIPSVCSYILQVLKDNRKFLVFAHHKIMLDAISKILESKSIQYIRVDGNTTSEQRNYMVNRFQGSNECTVALLSITAANAGITLTAADLVIFAELHWNPSILNQAESRAHRIGQLSPVNVKYLLAPGTADDFIWPLLQNKQKILEEVGLSRESFNAISVAQSSNSNERLTADLNISLNRTVAQTMDIASYFKSPEKQQTSTVEEDVFNDGFEEILQFIDC